MGIDWQKYPHIDGIHQHRDRFLQTAVNNFVFWEPKRDGSNISVMFHKGFFLVYTRNQKAVEAVEIEVKQILRPHMDNLRALLTCKQSDGKEVSCGVLYGELLRKGKSPARFESNDEPSFLAFDLFDLGDNKFVDPSTKYQLFEEHNIPFLKADLTTKVQSIDHLRQVVNEVIEIAKSKELEGYVGKWYDMIRSEQYVIKAKVEHKYPKPAQKKKQKRKDTRPALEYSELTGAIRRVHDEIGDDIYNTRTAMPLIARAVSEEARKHHKQNTYSIYKVYIDYLDTLR